MSMLGMRCVLFDLKILRQKVRMLRERILGSHDHQLDGHALIGQSNGIDQVPQIEPGIDPPNQRIFRAAGLDPAVSRWVDS